VIVDREKAAIYGLSTSAVGMAVRGAINGIEAAKYRTGNDEYDIIVRLAPEWRSQLNALQDLTVMDEGTQVPLVSVAEWEVGEGLGSIRRKDMDRMATVSADVAAGENSAAVLGEVQSTLTVFEGTLPPGYTLRYTGENLEQEEAQDFLASAFFAALALMGFILISQFNSVVKPVMIHIDVLRERDGMDRREALVQGGKARFRPVILTAVTTALGLIPLAVGLNFDFFGLFGSLNPDLYWGGDQAAWWAPMAIAVIVGILFATFLTLVLVPVMYSLVDDFSGFFRRHFVLAGAVPNSLDGSPVDEALPALEGAGQEREPAPVYRTGQTRPFDRLRLRPQPE
jgi:multidrug efflux pump subunit AcrB